MALDPNIALGVRPIQLEMPNQLAQELLAPVRDAAKKVIHGDLNKAELEG